MEPIWNRILANMTSSNKYTLDRDFLLSVLQYNPETGKFIWIKSLSKRVRVGSEAGSISKDGYIDIRLNKSLYKAHKLAFFIMEGRWPDKEIDHEDRNKRNNKWCNLRESNHSENNCNKDIRTDNKSGVPGVFFESDRNRYLAFVTKDRKRYNKCFSISIHGEKAYELAVNWVTSERKRLHGNFIGY